MSSIEEFGFTNPIMLNPEGRIIVGYARYLAAKKGKLSQAPVVILSHLSEAQQRAYTIADNQLALNASWDEEVLKHELEALIAWAFSIDLLGFSEEELKQTDEEFVSVNMHRHICSRRSGTTRRPPGHYPLASRKIFATEVPSHQTRD